MSNVINFRHAKLLRDLQKMRFLRIYSATIDPETGDYIQAPKPTGELTTSIDWSREEDDSSTRYTTFRPNPASEEEHALVISWATN